MIWLETCHLVQLRSASRESGRNVKHTAGTAVGPEEQGRGEEGLEEAVGNQGRRASSLHNAM
ncbi:hypothetical protein INR49_015625 [Caranx melampygus]|nr:hypothetical protein INR49_015625 [Caranx melampygus]